MKTAVLQPKKAVEAALARDPAVPANPVGAGAKDGVVPLTGPIDRQVRGATVTLRGRVHSRPERIAAQGVAWSAPGVGAVVDELDIG